MAMIGLGDTALPPIAVSEPGAVKAYDHTCPPGQTNTETGCFDGAAHTAQTNVISIAMMGAAALLLFEGNGAWKLAALPLGFYGFVVYGLNKPNQGF